MTRMTRIRRMRRHEIHGAECTDNRFYCWSGCVSVTAWEPGCALGDIRPIRVLRIHVWKYRT